MTTILQRIKCNKSFLPFIIFKFIAIQPTRCAQNFLSYTNATVLYRNFYETSCSLCVHICYTYFCRTFSAPHRSNAACSIALSQIFAFLKETPIDITHTHLYPTRSWRICPPPLHPLIPYHPHLPYRCGDPLLSLFSRLYFYQHRAICRSSPKTRKTGEASCAKFKGFWRS